jgi:predicted transcriptional regulator
MAKTRTIEIDEDTASALNDRASARGISVARLIGDMLSATAGGRDEIAELDRRWAAVSAGQPTVGNDEIVRWLETWGTPQYRSLPGR